jgi:hypothetical protein
MRTQDAWGVLKAFSVLRAMGHKASTHTSKRSVLGGGGGEVSMVVTSVDVGCCGWPHPDPGLTGGQKRSGIQRRCPTDDARWIYTPVKCGCSGNQEKRWGIREMKRMGEHSHNLG